MSGPSRSLASLADALLLTGFHGPVVPDWLRHRVSDSLGGVCLFSTNIVDRDQARTLTDSLRAERPDVIVSIDEEGGAVTRLDAADGSRFPGVAALGRIDDVDLTEQIGSAVGRLVAAAGVTLNFAPCADVMLDPMNPVIGIRSFGADPDLVARHTAAFVRGHQAAGVPTCAKHYPGHGDTDVDTHQSVAVIHSDLAAMRRDALAPFAAAIDAGAASIMAGHLLVPSVDSRPASVSRKWLTEILRRDMGFEGAVVTDALEMAAIADSYGLVEGAVMAVEAGADLLCLGANEASPELLDAIVKALVAAVRSGRIPEERLVEAADRVGPLGLRPPRVDPDDLISDRRTAADAGGRALVVVGDVPLLLPGVLVIRCEAGRNFAVGSVPWGPMAALPTEVGATEVLVVRTDVGSTLDELATTRLSTAPQILIVTNDRHRYAWMRDVLAHVRSVRPDAVLIEMGTTGVREHDAPALASYGSALANARAVVDWLGSSGRR